MKKALAVLLCIAMPSLTLAAEGYKVKYDGGSVQGIKTGAGLRLTFVGDQIKFTDGKTEVLDLPAKWVTEISYGQDVHRRIGAAIGIGVFTLGIGALMALTKSKKHFVGLTWAAGETKGGIAMQCEKGDYRGVLTGLEGVTGKKSVDSATMTVKN